MGWRAGIEQAAAALVAVVVLRDDRVGDRLLGGLSRLAAAVVVNDWLWGGSLDAISQTITHGVRSDDEQGRQGSMPAFGRDGMLKREDVLVVADYVRSLSGLSTTAGADLPRGAKIFADNCAVCHGPDGKGNRALGAPNLTDQIWLYSSDRETIIDGIWNGHGGVMPAWGAKLDPVTIKALTIYVHTFGGGE